MPQKKEFDLLGLGEVMIRLSPPGKARLVQCDCVEARAGGSELNVAAGASLLGLRTALVTKLPESAAGQFVAAKIRQAGVDDVFVVRDSSPDARVGLYYYENGAAPRKPDVVYDRRNSSFTALQLEEIPEEVYASAGIVHTSGITLALSSHTRQLAMQMLRRFKERGARISFDVNYRANLWDEQTARRALESVLPMVDVLFISEETSRRMFARTGTVEEIIKGFSSEYGISVVAMSERKVLSPARHSFGSVLFSREAGFFREAPYENIEVVDRIGSGDAYVAGVLSGLARFGDCRKALELGDACAALKNTVPGDLPATNPAEVEQLIRSHKNGGAGDEMNR